jgi:serine/threonine protein kinase
MSCANPTCKTTTGAIYPCKRCHLVKYCSITCLTADAERHEDAGCVQKTAGEQDAVGVQVHDHTDGDYRTFSHPSLSGVWDPSWAGVLERVQVTWDPYVAVSPTTGSVRIQRAPIGPGVPLGKAVVVDLVRRSLRHPSIAAIEDVAFTSDNSTMFAVGKGTSSSAVEQTLATYAPAAVTETTTIAAEARALKRADLTSTQARQVQQLNKQAEGGAWANLAGKSKKKKNLESEKIKAAKQPVEDTVTDPEEREYEFCVIAAYQMILAVAYCHESLVIHGGLSPNAFLMSGFRDEKGRQLPRVLLADFRRSFRWSKPAVAPTNDPAYQAPELIDPTASKQYATLGQYLADLANLDGVTKWTEAVDEQLRTKAAQLASSGLGVFAHINRTLAASPASETTYKWAIASLRNEIAQVTAAIPRSGFAADTWALGCTLYFLLTGQHLFGPTRSVPTRKKTGKQQLKAAIDAGAQDYRKGLAAVIIDMLSIDPGDRSNVASYLQYPVFTGSLKQMGISAERIVKTCMPGAFFAQRLAFGDLQVPAVRTVVSAMASTAPRLKIAHPIPDAWVPAIANQLCASLYTAAYTGQSLYPSPEKFEFMAAILRSWSSDLNTTPPPAVAQAPFDALVAEIPTIASLASLLTGESTAQVPGPDRAVFRRFIETAWTNDPTAPTLGAFVNYYVAINGEHPGMQTDSDIALHIAAILAVAWSSPAHAQDVSYADVALMAVAAASREFVAYDERCTKRILSPTSLGLIKAAVERCSDALGCQAIETARPGSHRRIAEWKARLDAAVANPTQIPVAEQLNTATYRDASTVDARFLIPWKQANDRMKAIQGDKTLSMDQLHAALAGDDMLYLAAFHAYKGPEQFKRTFPIPQAREQRILTLEAERARIEGTPIVYRSDTGVAPAPTASVLPPMAAPTTAAVGAAPAYNAQFMVAWRQANVAMGAIRGNPTLSPAQLTAMLSGDDMLYLAAFHAYGGDKAQFKVTFPIAPDRAQRILAYDTERARNEGTPVVYSP